MKNAIEVFRSSETPAITGSLQIYVSNIKLKSKKKQEKRFNDTPLNSILDGDEFSVMVQKAVDKSLKTITPQTVEPVKSRLEDTIKSLIYIAVVGMKTELRNEMKANLELKQR